MDGGEKLMLGFVISAFTGAGLLGLPYFLGSLLGIGVFFILIGTYEVLWDYFKSKRKKK